MSENENEIIQEMSESYKFRLPTQLLILIFIMIGMFIGLEFAPFTLETKIASFVILLGLVFPVIVNVRTKWRSAIALGLWGASSLLIIIWTIDFVLVDNIVAIGLYVAFLEIVLIEFLHHVGIEVIERTRIGYIIGTVLGAIFFVSISIFLYQISISYVIYFGLPLAVIFVYAILPERKI